MLQGTSLRVFFLLCEEGMGVQEGDRGDVV